MCSYGSGLVFGVARLCLSLSNIRTWRIFSRCILTPGSDYPFYSLMWTFPSMLIEHMIVLQSDMLIKARPQFRPVVSIIYTIIILF